MILIDQECRYRLSKSIANKRRAFGLIQSSQRKADRQFGQRISGISLWDDRRIQIRVPTQVPAYLRSAWRKGLTVFADPDTSPQLAVTRDVSLEGLGFQHDVPPPRPMFLAEFDVFENEPLIVLIEVRWCRKTNDWSYQSGGRIAGVCRPVSCE